MKTIELNYNVRVAQGHRFSKDVLRPWPKGATLADVMAELTTELQSLGCSDIHITKATSRKVDAPSFDDPTAHQREIRRRSNEGY